jgi:Protein of unknown function (DUF2802)
METFVVTRWELLIAVVAVLAIHAAELVVLLRWPGVIGLQRWKRGARSAADLVGQLLREIAELRRQVARLQGEVDKLRAAPQPAISPYTQAIQMARRGAGASEVASGCGISRGEAELIVALHRKLRI